MFRRETTAITDNKHNRACHYQQEMMPLDWGDEEVTTLKEQKNKREPGEIQSELILNDEGSK